VRKQVEPDDVRPPSNKLDLKSWLTAPDGVATPSDAPGDVTVIMQNRIKDDAGRQVQIRTIRRHYPWTYTEDVNAKGQRKITFKNQVERLSIVFQSNANGEPMQLSIEKELRAFADQKLPDSGRTETIVGETCVVSEKKYREAYSNQCRTADGVIVKDAKSDQGGMYDLIAVKLDRAPVDIDAVLPPSSLFVRAAWGIPD
jgi:hypothetical protein